MYDCARNKTYIFYVAGTHYFTKSKLNAYARMLYVWFKKKKTISILSCLVEISCVII